MLAFDEARFGLINWHRRRYCPKGFRPPYIVRRSYTWTYLYAALEPTTGESFCLYLPGMDRGCLQSFLDQLSEAYPHHHLLVVLDGAPSHRSQRCALVLIPWFGDRVFREREAVRGSRHSPRQLPPASRINLYEHRCK